MGYFKFLFWFFFLLPTSLGGKNSCKLTVKFPFRLQDQPPINCRYPSFDLGCNKQSKVTLNLPQSGDFFVRSIDYVRQEIRLHDPSGCIAKRLPELNLSGSPFKAISYMNLSFLSCSSQSFSPSSSRAVGCLSNSTNTVIAVPSINSFAFSYKCQELFGGRIQVPRSFQCNKDIFSQFYQLEDNIPLRWNVPDSEFVFNSSRITLHERKGNKGLQMIGVISFSVTFLAFLVLFLTKARLMRTRMNTATVQAQNSDQASATPPQPVNLVAGLDEATISSYAKVVLGESFRLPGATNDETCPICWSEYTEKETVKCIPECKHWFHADCIDEWLRLAGTCPICRVKLAPSPSNANL